MCTPDCSSHNFQNYKRCIPSKVSSFQTSNFPASLSSIHPLFSIPITSNMAPSKKLASLRGCCFSVMVCKDGDIKVKKGNQPVVTYTEQWIKDEKEDFYIAASNFCDKTGFL